MITKERLDKCKGIVFLHNPEKLDGCCGWAKHLDKFNNTLIKVFYDNRATEVCERVFIIDDDEQCTWYLDPEWLFDCDIREDKTETEYLLASPENKSKLLASIKELECEAEVAAATWSDKHYNFEYQLTEKDIEKGSIKLDPYFVAKEWEIGSKDDSGALWHCFKTIARFGIKNNKEREIKALHAQVVRMSEIYGVTLEEKD